MNKTSFKPSGPPPAKRRKPYQKRTPEPYFRAIRRANALGVPFSLDPSFFSYGECFYCGESGPREVDRINPSSPFSPTNSIQACPLCLSMKGAISTSAFIAQAKRIADHGA